MNRYDEARRIFAILSQCHVEVRLVADVPALAGLSLTTTNLDGLPVIGRYDSTTPHFVATGHFRNGILLAPGTARIIADLVCGVAPAIDLADTVALTSIGCVLSLRDVYDRIVFPPPEDEDEEPAPASN